MWYAYDRKKNYYTQLVRSFEKVWGSSSREEKKRCRCYLSYTPFQRSLSLSFGPVYVHLHTHTVRMVNIYIYGVNSEREKKRGLSVTVGPIFHVRYPVADFVSPIFLSNSYIFLTCEYIYALRTRSRKMRRVSSSQTAKKQLCYKRNKGTKFPWR